MSAHYISGEVKETKRYKLGRLAGSVARHFLLMTATPHAGIAPGFDRILMILEDQANLREVIAFPLKAGAASPSQIVVIGTGHWRGEGMALVEAIK